MREAATLSVDGTHHTDRSADNKTPRNVGILHSKTAVAVQLCNYGKPIKNSLRNSIFKYKLVIEIFLFYFLIVMIFGLFLGFRTF